MQTWTRIFLCLVICGWCGAAEVVSYVDPDVSGGSGDGDTWTDAYSSLSAWSAAEGTNLITDGDTHVVYCRSSSGTDDTSCTMVGDGWSANATYYITMIGVDFPADGIWDNSAYTIHRNVQGSGNTFAIAADYTVVQNFQIMVTETNASADVTGIRLSSVTGCVIDSCIIRGDVDDTPADKCRGLFGDSGTNTVINTVVYDFDTPDASTSGLYCTAGATLNCWNDTVYNCNYGLWYAGTLNAENVISCTSGTADSGNFGGTLNADYCASDDGFGTNAVAASSLDWDNEMTDANNGDFSLVGGNCQDGGTDDPGSGLYSDDIIGAARTSSWSVGAYEAASSTASGQIFPAIMVKHDRPAWLRDLHLWRGW